MTGIIRKRRNPINLKRMNVNLTVFYCVGCYTYGWSSRMKCPVSGTEKVNADVYTKTYPQPKR